MPRPFDSAQGIAKQESVSDACLATLGWGTRSVLRF
jgi:hypothetical protein